MRWHSCCTPSLSSTWANRHHELLCMAFNSGSRDFTLSLWLNRNYLIWNHFDWELKIYSESSEFELYSIIQKMNNNTSGVWLPEDWIRNLIINPIQTHQSRFELLSDSISSIHSAWSLFLRLLSSLLVFYIVSSTFVCYLIWLQIQIHTLIQNKNRKISFNTSSVSLISKFGSISRIYIFDSEMNAAHCQNKMHNLQTFHLTSYDLQKIKRIK